MTDERGDYMLLASISTHEEAAVMVAALQAEGIPAILGNGHNATAMGFGAVALGGCAGAVRPGGRVVARNCARR